MDITTALTLIGIALLAGFGYAITCLIWPYGSCRRCSGSGKLRSPFGGDAYRRCPRCKATGARLRLGRRLFSRWRELRKEIHK
jgi:hypothetical protein